MSLKLLIAECEGKNLTKEFTNSLIELSNTLARFFQIIDDYNNLQSETYHQNKSYCEDLTEGKFSFPVIHSINSCREQKSSISNSTQENTSTSSTVVFAPETCDHRLMNILKQRTENVNLKQYAVQLMKETGSFEYTKQACLKLYEKMNVMIQNLGGNQKLSGIVQYILQSANF